MRFAPIAAFCSASLMMVAQPAWAEPNCKPTARVATQNYPGPARIVPGNNLIKPAGKAVEANGQKIIIEGQVLDSRCAPVPEAVVELWQNSPTGRWLLAGAEDLANASPVFTGAGRTYTDHDGRFRFITAFPAPITYTVRRDNKRSYVVKRAPFVNVKVAAEKMPTLNTALYFSDDVRNDGDDIYRKLSGKTRSDVTITVTQQEDEQLVGDVKLVLSGKAPYRTY